MSQPLVPVEIPDKASFKPAEVCDIVQIPSYVLRTWENEFKDLGVAKSPGATRTYRRRDVEMALRIKELVFSEHLTLAGVRRRLEQEEWVSPPAVEAEAAPPAGGPAGPVLTPPARAALAQVKEELRSLLHALASHSSRGPLVAAEASVRPGVTRATPGEPSLFADERQGGATVSNGTGSTAVATSSKTTPNRRRPKP